MNTWKVTLTVLHPCSRRIPHKLELIRLCQRSGNYGRLVRKFVDAKDFIYEQFKQHPGTGV